jgi:hypothetical protein
MTVLYLIARCVSCRAFHFESSGIMIRLFGAEIIALTIKLEISIAVPKMTDFGVNSRME